MMFMAAGIVVCWPFDNHGLLRAVLSNSGAINVNTVLASTTTIFILTFRFSFAEKNGGNY